jgi:hypothetical protein
VQLISGGIYLRGADLGRKLIVWNIVNIWWLPERSIKKMGKTVIETDFSAL